MNTCYLDANVLIGFKDESNSLHDKAQQLLIKLIQNEYELRISPLVIDECLYAYTYLFKTIDLVMTALTDILALPYIQIVNPPTELHQQLEVIDYIKQFKLQPRDAYHLLTMKVHKIEYLATFDSDFERVFALGIIQRMPSFKKN